MPRGEHVRGRNVLGRDQGESDFKGVVPRASAIYDIKGDGRTAIKFAASRYDQPINISINQRLNPVGTTNDHARGRPALAARPLAAT
jgi:hypothetical protein